MILKLRKMFIGKDNGKPALWKRIIVKAAIGISNLFLKLTGEKHAIREKELIKDSVEEFRQMQKDIIEQYHRATRGGTRINRAVNPKKKKRGILDYGKFIDPKTGKELKPS